MWVQFLPRGWNSNMCLGAWLTFWQVYRIPWHLESLLGGELLALKASCPHSWSPGSRVPFRLMLHGDGGTQALGDNAAVTYTASTGGVGAFGQELMALMLPVSGEKLCLYGCRAGWNEMHMNWSYVEGNDRSLLRNRGSLHGCPG